jgi:amidase
VQFVGPFGSEDRLLQLAHQLEQAQPWFERLPDWVLADGAAAERTPTERGQACYA